MTPFEPDEEPRVYRCPPAWPRWAILAGGGATLWLGYLAVTSVRIFDVVLAGVLALVADVGTGAVLWRLWTWSTSASAAGLRLRRGRSTLDVPWSRVGVLRVENSAGRERVVCYETDGTRHVLPWITAGAGRVVRTEVAGLRRLWRAGRGHRWVPPSPSVLPRGVPPEPEQWGRAFLWTGAAFFTGSAVAVLLLDLSSRRAAPLDPATGIGTIVVLALALYVPVVIGFWIRRRPRSRPAPMGKRQARPR
jgi:hypothetical protein